MVIVLLTYSCKAFLSVRHSADATKVFGMYEINQLFLSYEMNQFFCQRKIYTLQFI